MPPARGRTRAPRRPGRRTPRRGAGRAATGIRRASPAGRPTRARRSRRAPRCRRGGPPARRPPRRRRRAGRAPAGSRTGRRPRCARAGSTSPIRVVNAASPGSAGRWGRRGSAIAPAYDDRRGPRPLAGRRSRYGGPRRRAAGSRDATGSKAEREARVAAVRKLAGLVAVVTLSASLAGCTSDDPEATPDPTPRCREPPASESPRSRSRWSSPSTADRGGSRPTRRSWRPSPRSAPRSRWSSRRTPTPTRRRRRSRASLADEDGPDVFLLDPAYLPGVRAGRAARAARHAARGARAAVRRRLPAGGAHGVLRQLPAAVHAGGDVAAGRLLQPRTCCPGSGSAPRASCCRAPTETWGWEEFAVAARARPR